MDSNVLSAIIGGTAGAVISFVSSYVVEKLKTRQEFNICKSDFAINYSKLLSEDQLATLQLARQFSVGLIIVRADDRHTVSKHFIPYQCKVSEGRYEDNDIVLTDSTVSRDHGVFFYKENRIYYQDFAPLNKTRINGKEINKIQKIKSGDIIHIGETTLEFEKLI